MPGAQIVDRLSVVCLGARRSPVYGSTVSIKDGVGQRNNGINIAYKYTSNPDIISGPHACVLADQMNERVGVDRGDCDSSPHVAVSKLGQFRSSHIACFFRKIH